MNKEKEFHKSRRMFYIHGECLLLAPVDDTRSHKEFINDLLVYESCVRGYYKDNKLFLYTGGDDFKPIVANILSNKLPFIIEALGLKKDVVIYNGVKKGKLGSEWEPIEQIYLV